MSRRRYISTDISTDPKVADLSEHHGILPLLLYTWAIPHMDDWGRMTGDAKQFKLLVCPGLNITLVEVEKCLSDIASEGLWLRYDVGEKRCLSIPEESWYKHQSYINKGKRMDDSGSNYPNPANCRKTPQIAEEHRETPPIAEEQQGLPQKTASFSLSSSLSPSPSLSVGDSYRENNHSSQNVFGVYQREIGNLSDTIMEMLIDMELTYSEEWVKQAIKTAVKQDVKKLAYIDGTLKKWKVTGHDEPWTLEKEEQAKGSDPPHSKNSYHKQQNKGFSGKPRLPIVEDKTPAVPLSEERREALRRKAQMLDGGMNGL